LNNDSTIIKISNLLTFLLFIKFMFFYLKENCKDVHNFHDFAFRVRFSTRTNNINFNTSFLNKPTTGKHAILSEAHLFLHSYPEITPENTAFDYFIF